MRRRKERRKKSRIGKNRPGDGAGKESIKRRGVVQKKIETMG